MLKFDQMLVNLNKFKCKIVVDGDYNAEFDETIQQSNVGYL